MYCPRSWSFVHFPHFSMVSSSPFTSPTHVRIPFGRIPHWATKWGLLSDEPLSHNYYYYFYPVFFWITPSICLTSLISPPNDPPQILFFASNSSTRFGSSLLHLIHFLLSLLFVTPCLFQRSWGLRSCIHLIRRLASDHSSISGLIAAFKGCHSEKLAASSLGCFPACGDLRCGSLLYLEPFGVLKGCWNRRSRGPSPVEYLLVYYWLCTTKGVPCFSIVWIFERVCWSVRL